MFFLKLSFKNLLRHRIRSLITMFSICCAVAVLFSLLSFNSGFKKGLEREIERTGIDFMVVDLGCPYEVASLVLHGAVIPQYLDEDVIEKLKEFDEIQIASPMLVMQIENLSQAEPRLDLVYGFEMSDIKKIKPSWKIKGNIPMGEDEIIIGSLVAKSYRLKEGDEVIYSKKREIFKVSGILERTASQDDAAVYMPIQSLQRLVNKPDGITSVGIKLKDPGMFGYIRDKISIKIPGTQIVTMGQIAKSISSLASSARVMSLSIAVIAVIISVIGVTNSILMTVFERTQEIGMMRAIGASRGDIFRIGINETIILTSVGGAFGIFISIIGSKFIEDIVRSITPYVPAGDMIVFDPVLAALIFILSVLLGIISGLYPAWKASRVSPVEALNW